MQSLTVILLLTVWSGCGAVYEYAYNLTQQMDPMNQGRGVLQFKSALKSVLMVRASGFPNGFVEANPYASLMMHVVKSVPAPLYSTVRSRLYSPFNELLEVFTLIVAAVKSLNVQWLVFQGLHWLARKLSRYSEF